MPERRWTTDALLKARARRVDEAQAALTSAVVDAYRQGMSTRAIGRAIGRSHRWVIALLKAENAYNVAMLAAVTSDVLS